MPDPEDGDRRGVIDIDNQELEALMAGGVPLVDIRTAQEWLQTGVVPGSHLLTFFDVQGQADPGAWISKAAEIAQQSEPMILICRSGHRTGVVAQFLNEQYGFTKLYNVSRGILAWANEARALQRVAQDQVA